MHAAVRLDNLAGHIVDRQGVLRTGRQRKADNRARVERVRVVLTQAVVGRQVGRVDRRTVGGSHLQRDQLAAQVQRFTSEAVAGHRVNQYTGLRAIVVVTQFHVAGLQRRHCRAFHNRIQSTNLSTVLNGQVARLVQSIIDINRGDRGRLRERIGITNHHTNQIHQVSHRQRQTIGIDIGRRYLTLLVDVKGRKTVDEVVREDYRIGDLVRNLVEVDVAASVKRLGTGDIDTAVPEVDHTQRIRLVVAQSRVARRIGAKQAREISRRIINRIGTRNILKLIDVTGDKQAVTSYRRNGVVATVVPAPPDRHVLAFQRTVIGHIEVQRSQLAVGRRGEAARMSGAVVGLGQSRDTQLARRTDARTAVAVGSKAVLEVLPAALVKKRATIGSQEVQRRSVVLDQEVETAHLVGRLNGAVQINGHRLIAALDGVVGLLDIDRHRRYYVDRHTAGIGIARAARATGGGAI